MALPFQNFQSFKNQASFIEELTTKNSQFIDIHSPHKAYPQDDLKARKNKINYFKNHLESELGLNRTNFNRSFN